MRNENNDCIRYLMKEMDPSEELLMERAMMEDEDLLIEVESMRQTLKKLDKLPEMEPPSYVTDAVREKAAEQARKNRKSNRSFQQPAFKYAVAATLALTLTAGGAWFFVETEKSGSEQQRAVSSATASAPAQVADNSEEGRPSNDGASVREPSTTAQAGTSTVDPWVDRNDVLRFEDQFSNQNDQYKAILEQSTQKLRLIENPSVNGGRVNSVQLTGSGN